MAENETPPETPEYSEIELQALDHGWKPKDQFDESSGKKWRTAEDFMDRKSLFDKIDDQHRQIRDLRRGMDSFAEHNRKIEVLAYEKALKDLKAQRKEAIAEGDMLRAEEINDKMDEIRSTAVQAIQSTPPPQPPAEFNAWLAANPWYQNDPDLRAYADGVGNQLVASGVKGQELLAEVARKAREFAPHKFRNPNKNNAVPAETGGRKSTKEVSNTLSADEERIMNNMIRAGAPITREEYIKQLRG